MPFEFIYLIYFFHHDYNAKIRLGKKIHLNKSEKREAEVQDTKQNEAPN